MSQGRRLHGSPSNCVHAGQARPRHRWGSPQATASRRRGCMDVCQPTEGVPGCGPASRFGGKAPLAGPRQPCAPRVTEAFSKVTLRVPTLPLVPQGHAIARRRSGMADGVSPPGNDEMAGRRAPASRDYFPRPANSSFSRVEALATIWHERVAPALGITPPVDEGRPWQRQSSGTGKNPAMDEERARNQKQEQWLSSPLGQATSAMEQGQGFFELQLEVGSSQREINFMQTRVVGENRIASHAGVLCAIEQLGWRLEHVGHVFVPTGEHTRQTLSGFGHNSAVTGVTLGIYLFRNAKTS
jgi:hypothetical protein